jgi:hypothetical protein
MKIKYASTITVDRLEAMRLASILVSVTGEGCVDKTHLLHETWKWAMAMSHTPRLATRTLDEDESRMLDAVLSVYMERQKLATLDEIDISIVRAMLHHKP